MGIGYHSGETFGVATRPFICNFLLYMNGLWTKIARWHRSFHLSSAVGHPIYMALRTSQAEKSRDGNQEVEACRTWMHAAANKKQQRDDP